MGVKSAQITVPTTAAVPLFVSGSGTTQFANVNGAVGDELPTLIENTDATNNVYLGASGVTSSTGFLLKAGATLPISWLGSDATTLFAVATGASVTVCLLAGRQ